MTFIDVSVIVLKKIRSGGKLYCEQFSETLKPEEKENQM